MTFLLLHIVNTFIYFAIVMRNLKKYSESEKAKITGARFLANMRSFYNLASRRLISPILFWVVLLLQIAQVVSIVPLWRFL